MNSVQLASWRLAAHDWAVRQIQALKAAKLAAKAVADNAGSSECP